MHLQRVSETRYVRPARGPPRLGQGSLREHLGAQDIWRGRGAFEATEESGEMNRFSY